MGSIPYQLWCRRSPGARAIACGEIPPPFDALDAAVYLDYGPVFAVEWAERTVDALA